MKLWIYLMMYKKWYLNKVLEFYLKKSKFQTINLDINDKFN